VSSITKRAASPEVLAAASEKAQEIRKTHAALPPAERQRRKAMGAAAAGGALLAPIGGAVGGALGAEKGNRGRTALRAGLGALGGGVVGALTGRRLGVYMGQGLGAAVGANSAHKAHQRVKERAIREYEASKTAALLDDIIDRLEKRAALGPLFGGGAVLTEGRAGRGPAAPAFANSRARALKKKEDSDQAKTAARLQGLIEGLEKEAGIGNALRRAAPAVGNFARKSASPAVGGATGMLAHKVGADPITASVIGAAAERAVSKAPQALRNVGPRVRQGARAAGSTIRGAVKKLKPLPDGVSPRIKTAALLEGIIEGLEKHAGVIGDLINETGKITARTQRIRQGARDKYHKAAINAEEAAYTRVRRQNVARDLKHLRATTGPGYRESIKHPSRMFRALERDNARRALRKAIRGLRA
jgi:hypothetical protein